MASMIGIALATLVAYLLYSTVSRHLKHIAVAKSIGLPYIVTPFSCYNDFWLVTYPLWFPLLSRFPKAWTENRLLFLLSDWPSINRFEPFKNYGSDILLTVSPGGIYVWLSNAEAIHQITTRRESFPKPTESYKILELFGRNVLTTEGAEWRQHRKITAPGFNEKNNALVFTESCSQTVGMLNKWTSDGEFGKKTIETVATDAMRLTLHIISKVGFGVQLLWPGQSPSDELAAGDTVYGGMDKREGHSMDFEFALEVLLEKLILVMIVPKFILRILPFKSCKIAYGNAYFRIKLLLLFIRAQGIGKCFEGSILRFVFVYLLFKRLLAPEIAHNLSFYSANPMIDAYVNWKNYMNELFVQKVREAREGRQSSGMDIMGSLVKSSYGNPNISGERKLSPEQAEKGIAPTLSDSEIFGNAFIMLVAGHETTANSVHFCLVDLAIRPKTQKLLHKEVETIFGDEPSENWNYDKSINALLGGIIGAVLNEQLRVMPPVINIPKSVTKNQDQVIVLDGKKFTLPAGSLITLNTIAAHRNPKNWPSQPSKITGAENDLDDFRPERWLIKTSSSIDKKSRSGPSSEDEEDSGDPIEEATSSRLFRPVKGSYIPFSEGARSCLGRRVAQVEMMAVLAVFFQKHSVELAVDEWATDDAVAKMSDDEKRDVYKKAQEKAREMLRSARTIITLKIQQGFIPLRIVKKGEERFFL